ncbi:MAG: sensor histidine kinase [Acidimicrobiales bacterium]
MSLRARLLVGVSAVVLVLVGAAVIITRTTEADLVERIDDQLRAVGPRVREFGFDGVEVTAHGPSQLFLGLIQSDGQIATAIPPNLTDEDPPLPSVSAEQALDAAQDPRPEPFTVESDSGSDKRFRVLVAHPPGPPTTVLLGLPLTDVDASISRLIRVEVLATALIAAALGLVTFWVIRLGVRPIKQMTQTATAIAAGDLSHRVPTVANGTEAGELGLALNAMLSRIEDAFAVRAASEARLRQFVADASHELRTPVTTIRGYAELYQKGGLDEPEALAQAMRRTEQESIRMGSLVDDLLLLARLDQGRPLEQSPVDLSALAVDAVTDARAADPGRPIGLEVEDGVTVLGDESRLRQVVANLVGNAVVHTAPDTPVRVAVSWSDGRAVLEVADDGPGMEPGVATRAFERFFRADPARARHAGGSGLGLSIVKAIVDAHGGQVSMQSDPGRGTAVRVELPAGQLPAGQLPAGAVPAGEVPTGEVPAGQLPAGEVPAGEVPER